MKILVCVKQVPETNEVKLGADYTLQREFTAQSLNLADESALELGLVLRDACGGTVTVMTMGPASAEGMLRELVARGADDAVLLNDPAFAGADTLATARTLKAAHDKLGGFDLVLCGRRASDGETGQVGPMLASILDIPCVSNATDARICNDDGSPATMEIDQLLENGVQTWRCRLPAVATFCEWSRRLRLPTIAGLRAAGRVGIHRLTRPDLELPADHCGLAGSPTRVIRVSAKPAGLRQCEKLTVEELLAKGVLG
ncbi:MAG: electron transfer flavoprotein subunit beta/FixA family protein [Eubacteriales bacterium]|nr:electron transfer flavoprotein subunit beta/FixA family protein [Eubacteriales bacterium]